MKTRIIDNTEDFYKLKTAWERLQEQDPDVTYYYTYEYVRTWCESHKNDKNIHILIVCVYQNDDIVGIGPFMIQRLQGQVFSYNFFKFLGRGDYLGVLLQRGQNNEMTILKDMFQCLQESKSLWDKMHLTHIKAGSLLAHFFFRQEEYNSSFRHLIECPRLNLKKFSGFQEYKKYFVSKNVRKYRNKLQREHSYTFAVKGTEDPALINQIMSMHRETQKHLADVKGRRERHSLFDESRMREHIANLCRNNENGIVFLLLDSKGEIIMYRLGFLYKRVFHSWNTSYNPTFEKYHVGRILCYEIMQYLLDKKIADVFDFGTGRYPWKFEWVDDFVLVYQIEMWNMKSKRGKMLMKFFELKSIVRQVINFVGN